MAYERPDDLRAVYPDPEYRCCVPPREIILVAGLPDHKAYAIQPSARPQGVQPGHKAHVIQPLAKPQGPRRPARHGNQCMQQSAVLHVYQYNP